MVRKAPMNASVSVGVRTVTEELMGDCHLTAKVSCLLIFFGLLF